MDTVVRRAIQSNLSFVTLPAKAMFLLASAAVPALSAAGNWEVTPRVDVRETYTDNVRLASDGNEQHELITDVAPAIRIRGTGGAVTADIDYRFQTLYYARNTRGRETNHQFQGSGSAEFLERSLFLDARATMSQANVDNTGLLSTDNINVTGNSTDVQTFDVSPYYLHRFGRWATTESRLRYNTVSTDGANSDSSAVEASVSVSSGSAFPVTPWNIRYTTQHVDRTNGGSDSEFSSINGNIEYRFSRRYGVNASVGYDDNTFDSSNSSTGGVRWQVGGDWNPTSRTQLGVGYGRQFSGSNVSLDFQHRWRHSVISAEFSEAVSTTRQRLLEQVLVPLQDSFGDPILDPVNPGQQFQIPVNTETLTDETQVQSNFRLNYAFKGRRTTLQASQFYTTRDFQLSRTQETTFGANASIRRELGSRYSASASSRWQTSDAGGGDTSTWSLSGRLAYDFSREAIGSLGYRYSQTDADTVAGDSIEKRLTASLQVSF